MTNESKRTTDKLIDTYDNIEMIISLDIVMTSNILPQSYAGYR